MKYDFYNKDRLYKPGLAVKCRNRLHKKILQGLNLKSVCEVGVGFAEFANYCRDNGISWVGIDANDNLCNLLRQEGFTVYKSVMPQFPEIQEECDAVFASHFIEHLNNVQEALAFVQSSRDLLKSKGGRYIILLYPDIEKIGAFFWQDYTHSFVTTKKRIEDLLYDSDFEIVKSGRYTACFFRLSGLTSFIGKIFPYFLLPAKIALFARLSFQQHSYTIAKIKS